MVDKFSHKALHYSYIELIIKRFMHMLVLARCTLHAARAYKMTAWLVANSETARKDTN